MSTRSSLHVSTTATRAQLPAVRVLAASLRTHHAEAELSVLLLDGDEAVAEAGRGVERCTLLAPDAVDVPADLFAKLAMACTADELAAVLAPRLVHLLVGQSVPAVIALSPETEVVGPLDEVIALAAEHGIVLVPRVDAPLPDDGLEPDESQLREAGPFASELVAVGANGRVVHRVVGREAARGGVASRRAQGGGTVDRAGRGDVPLPCAARPGLRRVGLESPFP